MLEILAHLFYLYKKDNIKQWKQERYLKCWKFYYSCSHMTLCLARLCKRNKCLEFLLYLIFIQSNEYKRRIVYTLDIRTFLLNVKRLWWYLVCRYIYFFFQFSQFLPVCYCIIMNWRSRIWYQVSNEILLSFILHSPSLIFFSINILDT